MAKRHDTHTGEEIRPIAVRMIAASLISGLSVSTLYEEIAAGRLKSRKVAGRRLILRDDLEAYLRGSQEAA